MVRLTADLIEQSAQYTNPVRDRELDLRGNVLPFSPARSFSISFTQIFNFQFRIIIFRLIRVPAIGILLFLFGLCGVGGEGANGSHCCVVND